MRGGYPAAPRPHPAGYQAQNAARLGVHPHHRVQQHAPPDALADFAQATIPLLGRGEVDLAGVLDRQNVPICAGFGDFRAPAFDHRFHRHPRIRKKSRVSDDSSTPPPRQTTKADALPRHHLRQKQTPLFARRSSPNSPSGQPVADIALPLPCKTRESNHGGGAMVNRVSTDDHEMCASPSAFAGMTTLFRE